MTLFGAREVGRYFINTQTYFFSSPTVAVPDQLWLGDSWPARGEAGSLWDSASHGGMPHLASLEFSAWREVHTLFRPSGSQGLCWDNLDKKICCSKGSSHHLVLKQPRVLFPKCWWWLYIRTCYRRAWHPSVWTKRCRAWYFPGFVLPRLKRVWAALHGWERRKIWPVHLEFVFAKFWSVFYSFAYKWQNAHVPLKSFGNHL